MKIKKKCLSTKLRGLYGKDEYQSHIEVGREYWYFFDNNTDVFEATHKCWNKIRVTYIRSGCVFYDFPDNPELDEEFCPLNCLMTSEFEFAEIDPIKDLGTEFDDKINRLVYYFDDKHTIVKNWPNEKEVEVDENKLKFKELCLIEVLTAC